MDHFVICLCICKVSIDCVGAVPRRARGPVGRSPVRISVPKIKQFQTLPPPRYLNVRLTARTCIHFSVCTHPLSYFSPSSSIVIGSGHPSEPVSSAVISKSRQSWLPRSPHSSQLYAIPDVPIHLQTAWVSSHPRNPRNLAEIET